MYRLLLAFTFFLLYMSIFESLKGSLQFVFDVFLDKVFTDFSETSVYSQTSLFQPSKMKTPLYTWNSSIQPPEVRIPLYTVKLLYSNP